MKTSSAQKSNNKGNTLRKSCENLPPFQLDKEQKDQSKLNHLEINLNRVCLQQDALMPLLQMIEYIPAIQRTDSVVKGLLRKIEDNEQRILKSEKILEQKSKNDLAEQQKEQKKQLKLISELNSKVKDMESKMSVLTKWCEAKQKEESPSTVLKTQETLKSERLKSSSDISKRVSTENSKTHSKQQSQALPTEQSQQSQEQYQHQILSAVENIVSSQLQNMRTVIQSELNCLKSQLLQKE